MDAEFKSKYGGLMNDRTFFKSGHDTTSGNGSKERPYNTLYGMKRDIGEIKEGQIVYVEQTNSVPYFSMKLTYTINMEGK